MFPCKYSSGGCTVSLLHTEKVWLDFEIHVAVNTMNLRWTMRRLASFDLTLVLVLVLAASGRAALNR